jgi:hypothetical protein
MFKVTLFNQHAQCGYSGKGRHPKAAYRAALRNASKQFVTYRRTSSAEWSDLDGYRQFDALWADVFFQRRASRAVSFYSSRHDGLGLELRKEAA